MRTKSFTKAVVSIAVTASMVVSIGSGAFASTERYNTEFDDKDNNIIPANTTVIDTYWHNYGDEEDNGSYINICEWDAAEEIYRDIDEVLNSNGGSWDTGDQAYKVLKVTVIKYYETETIAYYDMVVVPLDAPAEEPAEEPETPAEEPVEQVTVETSSAPAPVVLTPEQLRQMSMNNFVENLYIDIFGRQFDVEGRDFWVACLDQGWSATDVVRGFLGSSELAELNLSDEAYVTMLYKVFCNRVPDAEGFTNWTNALAAGASRYQIVSEFAATSEWADKCIYYGVSV
ncbi:MAG: DUF4214 domain-containing protein [Clostridiales bacterium]|nr:DUF4214 domain-containing protein [Clostridiales bacterium]